VARAVAQDRVVLEQGADPLELVVQVESRERLGAGSERVDGMARRGRVGQDDRVIHGGARGARRNHLGALEGRNGTNAAAGRTGWARGWRPSAAAAGRPPTTAGTARADPRRPTPAPGARSRGWCGAPRTRPRPGASAATWPRRGARRAPRSPAGA